MRDAAQAPCLLASTVMRTIRPLELLLVGLALSCGSAHELAVQQDPLDAETLTLTIVKLDRRGEPTISHKLISRRQQLDMVDERALERGLTPPSGTPTGKVARKSQGLGIDPDCGGSSLWIYDQPNLGGNMTCLTSPGKVDLATVCAQWTWVYYNNVPLYQYCSKYWFNTSLNTSNIRSYWAGIEPGSILQKPNGICATTCSSWNAYDRVNDVTCGSLGRWLELTVWGKACWLGESAYSFTWESPSNVSYGWTEAQQGLAHSSTHVFLTQTLSNIDGWVSKQGLSESLAIELPRYKPRDGWHYGDPDYHNGWLWVPFEGPPGRRLTAFSDDLMSVVFDVALPDHASAAWVAWNPADGTVYMSPLYDSNALRQYAVLTNPVQAVVLLRTIPLINIDGSPKTIVGVQGGAFSNNGHLYLSSNNEPSPLEAGFYGVDVESGTVVFHKYFENHPGWGGDEIEGIDVNPSWPMYAGHIHISMIDVGPDDDIYLKHFSINDISKL